MCSNWAFREKSVEIQWQVKVLLFGRRAKEGVGYRDGLESVKGGTGDKGIANFCKHLGLQVKKRRKCGIGVSAYSQSHFVCE